MSQAIALPHASRLTLVGHGDAGDWRLEFSGIEPATLALVVDLLQGARRSHAFVANRTHTAITVEPVAVVDFYADEKEGTHDA